MQIFVKLKDVVNKFYVLIYFDLNQIFHINISTSHKFRFKVILFYNKTKKEIQKCSTTKKLLSWPTIKSFD